MYFKINPSTYETYSAECPVTAPETFAKITTTSPVAAFIKTSSRITNIADE